MEPRLTFYRAQGSQPKEPVTREQFYAAAEVAGLVLYRPTNFLVGDVHWGFETHVPEPTEEEIAELKANWLEARKNPGPVKLLLDEGDKVPDGWPADQVEWRPSRIEGMPDGIMSFGGILASGIHDNVTWEIKNPPAAMSERYGFPINKVIKMQGTVEVSGELLADSQIDLERFFRDGPLPVAPFTRRQKFRIKLRLKRFQLGKWVYYKITGEYPDYEE